MLAKFEVENFRGFQDRLTFDLAAAGYDFNGGLVSNGIVKNALVFGRNGSGKSALGLAIFDIVRHLTDTRQIDERMLQPYRSLGSGDSAIAFKYVFAFGKDRVTYAYEKFSPNVLAHESLWLNEENVIDWNYRNGEGNLFKTETLGNVNLEKRSKDVSVLRYLYRTQGNAGHPLVANMMAFVENMVFADTHITTDRIAETIRNQDKLADFQAFLSKHGIPYELQFRQQDGKDVLVVKFGTEEALFESVASTGTMELTKFFYWRVAALPSASLLFIDEFDASVHFESARAILEALNETRNLQVVLTTHSTYLMQNTLTRPDCCFIIADNRVTPLFKATDKEVRLAHNLEKMYTHGIFHG